ncbi:hypothetical protein CK203_039980 [Vitis vinifera]|uniref:Retrotransposon gag domain-containing protein n=2 Tax=Vitis vinifera TaxID=29760 RepID=A0A438I2W1_VITVI|nr:hypothetical protein CK203_039980 [Vitis vinifera]
MSSSNVEETSEQTHGRKIEPATWGKGRKDKSHDVVANMEARLAKVELAMEDTREGVDLIKKGMEKGLEDLREHIQDLREGVLGSQEVRQELAIYKAVVSARIMAIQEASRVEVSKPQGFSGEWDAKELDNFLWHIERYFEAITSIDEVAKTWEDFKKEIKRQFYLEDVAYLARKNIRYLKHTDSIRDYVKEFSSLMLGIPNMIEKELLFNFMDNFHAMGEGDEVSMDHNALRIGSSKGSNVREERDNEIIVEMITKFTNIVNGLETLGKTYKESEKVMKILRSLPTNLDAKVTVIQEAKDLTKVPLEELIGSLMTFEITLAKRQ